MTTPTPPMGCRDAVAKLWDLLDGELQDEDRTALDRHLAWCLRCCGELAFAREVRGMLRERSAVAVPDDVRDRLEAFIDVLPVAPGRPAQ